jgi:hypothetical protein
MRKTLKVISLIIVIIVMMMIMATAVFAADSSSSTTDQNVINTILTGVLIPILPTITAFIVALLKKKKDEITSKINNETFNKYISLAENVIETSVVSINQTMVDTQKASGSWDSTSASAALEKARQTILTCLGDGTKAALNSAFGDLNNYITARIEYYVNLKKTTKSTVINAA